MRTLKGLDKLLTDLEGRPLVEQDGSTVAVKTIVANAIARGSSEEPARAMAVAMDIYKSNGEVEIEDADFALIEKAVKEDTMMNNMAKAAALSILE